MTATTNPNDDHYKLIGIYIITIAVIILWLPSSCATKKSTESYVEHHSMTELTERMDSMMHNIGTWQESIYQREKTLIDSVRQSEVRDTSRTIFLGAKGDTIREIQRIYIERNTQQKTKDSEKESLQERFRQIDSLLQVCNARYEKYDSLLQDSKKATVVEKAPSFMEKLKWVVLGFVVALIGMFAIIAAYMKKR